MDKKKTLQHSCLFLCFGPLRNRFFVVGLHELITVPFLSIENLKAMRGQDDPFVMEQMARLSGLKREGSD